MTESTECVCRWGPDFHKGQPCPIKLPPKPQYLIDHERRLAVSVTWSEGDTVTVDGREGIVRYVYTNGFTLVVFPGEPITGGIFNNDSTFGNDRITKEA